MRWNDWATIAARATSAPAPSRRPLDPYPCATARRNRLCLALLGYQATRRHWVLLHRHMGVEMQVGWVADMECRRRRRRLWGRTGVVVIPVGPTGRSRICMEVGRIWCKMDTAVDTGVPQRARARATE